MSATLPWIVVGTISGFVYTLQKYIRLNEAHTLMNDRLQRMEGEMSDLKKREKHLWQLYNIRYRPDFVFPETTESPKIVERK